MRTLARHVLFALVLVACKDKAPEPAATPPAAPAPAANPAAKAYDGPTFTISSTLPGPEMKERPLETGSGHAVMKTYVFTDPSDANTAQMVQTTHLAITADEEQLAIDNAMTGTTGDLKATIDDKKMMKVGATPMLDFTAHFTDEDGTFFLRGRIAVKNGTLYQTLAMGTGTKPSASARTFVDTFVVK
jgi:hypothetical protein